MSDLISYDVIVIDGSDAMYRSFFALPPLKSPSGFPTSAITGTLNMIDRLKSKFSGEIVVVFDPPTKNHRHTLHPSYKQHRKPMPDDLRVQWTCAIELLVHMGYKVIQKDHFEADDVIATLVKTSHARDERILIVSHDKDIAQCVDESSHIYQPTKGILLDRAKVYEKWQIYPSQMRDYLALVGDASDGFEGVAGVGNKTAIKWLEKYSSLDAIWNHRSEITGKVGENLRGSEAILDRNRILASLVDDIDIVDEDWMIAPNESLAAELLTSYGMSRRIPKSTSLPTWQLKNFDTDAIPCTGKRYWFVTAVDKTSASFQLCLWHSHEVWSSSMDKHQLVEYLKSLTWTDEDCLWDTHVLHHLGVDLPESVMDVSLLLYAFDSGVVSKGLLDAYASQNLQALSAKEVFDLLPEDQYYPYHAYVLHLLHEKRQISDLYKNLERPLVKVLSEMEDLGVELNSKLLNDLSETILLKLKACQERVDEVAGYGVNLLSPLQLRNWIYEELKAPARVKTQTGQWSTAEDALENLVGDYPILQEVLDFRMLSKLRSTYCEGLVKLVDESTGRLHTHYDQRGTITGRFSSSEPNLQNIPVRSEMGRKIRDAFVAQRGYVLVSADYSQVELRLMAHFSQDEQMMSALQSGGDIHSQTAAWLYKIPLDEVTSEMRRFSKTINFGLLYGMSAFGLAKQLHLSSSEAKEMIENYFSVYPSVKRYREGLLEEASNNGYITTLLGKRISLDRNSKNKGWMERLALNAPMQGSASEIIKKAMIQLSNHPWGDECCMLLQVHDELIFEVAEDKLQDVIPWIRKVMTSAVTLSVPLEVSMQSGKSWGEMKNVDA